MSPTWCRSTRSSATIGTLPRFDLDAFLTILQNWPIALAHVAPPVVVALAKHPAVDNYDLSRVKWLFSGAAPLGAELTDAVERRLNVRVRQGTRVLVARERAAFA